MKNFLALTIFSFFLFTAVICNSAYAKDNKKSVYSKKVANLALINYMNSFNNLDELTKDLELWGVLKHEDTKEIKAFLLKKNVTFDLSLQKATISGESILFGSIKWVHDKKQGFRARDGIYLKPKEYSTAAALFIAMYKLQAGENGTVSEYKFEIISSANAGAVAGATSVAGSALGSVVKHAAATVFGDVFAPAVGVLGMVVGGGVELLMSAIRKFIYKGSVKCTEDGYSIINAFDDNLFKERWKDATSNVEFARKKEDFLGKMFTGHFDFLGKVSFAGVLYFAESFSLKEQSTYVSNQALEDIFHTGKVPKCDKKNALKVEKYLKEELVKEMEKAKEATVSTDSKKSRAQDK